jgi:anti-sigma B factor antagonist
MSTTADITMERDGTALVASLRGEVDMTNASYVREELTGAVPNDAHALVIDLSGARYLDSAAIEVLFELSRRLGRRRQQLRLVVPPESPLHRLLMVTEVASVAPVHETLAAAVRGA